MTESDNQPLRIGVVSDTHGWLDPALLEIFQGVGLILHAGDVGDEAILDRLAECAPVAAVRGNVDGGPLADLPLDLVLDVAGRRLAMRHIAGSPLRPDKAALELVTGSEADVFVCGHSHIPVATRRQDVLWLNPGAAGRQGHHETRTAAILELAQAGTPRVLSVLLGPRGRPRA